MPIRKLTKKKIDLINLAKAGGKDSDLVILNKIHSIEDTMDDLGDSFNIIKKDIANNLKNDSVIKEKLLIELNEGAVVKLAMKLVKLRKGEKGDAPTEKELLKLIRPLIPPRITDSELIALITPLIPPPAHGKDADEKTMVQEVLAQIKLPEYKETVLDDPTQLRNKLETLKGEDELKLTIIKTLEERIKELEDRPVAGRTPFGGSVVHKFIDDETLTGTVNSTNKIFTTAKTPVNGSLKVYVNGQRMRVTEDYTLSNKTVTFITAPPTTSVLLCDYRYF